jgi:hypothetical protein
MVFPFCNPVTANDSMPEIVISGLKAYEKNGPRTAIEAWIKGSPFEGSKEALSQANRFKEIEAFYGNYIGYSLIHITKLTPSAKIVYFSINFHKGPVFAIFPVYKTKGGWIMTGRFNFHTDATQILPGALLAK